jgi:NhaD family Na+/H+ antiporter
MIFIMMAIFVLGYTAIVFEHVIKVSKSAVAILLGVTCWACYFLMQQGGVSSSHLQDLQIQVSGVSQILFFLLGSMAIVEIIDAHKGFKIVRDAISTNSRRKMLWIISLSSFFLSAILDNLTTTIVMIALLREIVPQHKDRLLLGCLVVIAANAGGAWTPMGDVTTTMLWIGGHVSSFGVIKHLFFPSLIALLVPLIYFTIRSKGKFSEIKDVGPEKKEPGSFLVLILGLCCLIFVPFFKFLTGLPPFMGILIGLAVMWLVTDGLHGAHKERKHLRVPHILTRVDIPGILFFLGILFAVGALESADILERMSKWLNSCIHSLPLIAWMMGILSAVIDNVPLVSALMGMYSIEQFPIDHSLWLMIAYAAGVGGSLLIIGSAAGIALMGMEKVNFVQYVKLASFPALVGYILGMGVYLYLNGVSMHQ